MSMANKIKLLKLYNVPWCELTQAQNGLNHANRLLFEARIELESTKVEENNLRS